MRGEMWTTYGTVVDEVVLGWTLRATKMFSTKHEGCDASGHCSKDARRPDT